MNSESPINIASDCEVVGVPEETCNTICKTSNVNTNNTISNDDLKGDLDDKKYKPRRRSSRTFQPFDTNVSMRLASTLTSSENESDSTFQPYNHSIYMRRADTLSSDDRSSAGNNNHNDSGGGVEDKSMRRRDHCSPPTGKNEN